jgi:hypothetical protein
MGNIREPSDRSFGFLIAAALLIPGLRHRWALAASAAMLAAALLAPPILRGPKRAWLLVGDVLSSIANPVVLGVLFFGVLAPAGALMRLVGRDPLRLKTSTRLPTYWIERTMPGSDMDEQF